jgi:hypothetical protein
MVSSNNVINELVCKIEGQLDQSQTFKMEINGQWVNGPLDDWLKTMTNSQREAAIDRHKSLISWVYLQLECKNSTKNKDITKKYTIQPPARYIKGLHVQKIKINRNRPSAIEQ